RPVGLSAGAAEGRRPAMSNVLRPEGRPTVIPGEKMQADNRQADVNHADILEADLLQVDISPVAAVRSVADRPRTGPALWYEGTETTYPALVERAGRLAEALAAGGVTKGSRVAYLGLNSPTLLATYLASAWLGAVF